MLWRRQKNDTLRNFKSNNNSSSTTKNNAAPDRRRSLPDIAFLLSKLLLCKHCGIFRKRNGKVFGKTLQICIRLSGRFFFLIFCIVLLFFFFFLFRAYVVYKNVWCLSSRLLCCRHFSCTQTSKRHFLCYAFVVFVG